MADEAPAAEAPPPPAVVAPLIERIVYGSRGLTSVGVIEKINECVAHNKQILLEMMFDDRFDATVAMENTIVRNSRHIKKIEMLNFCNEKEEHRKCFSFFTRIVQGIIGNGKHLRYINDACGFEFELEQANQLAEAIVQSNNNNNNNGSIESFDFHECNLTPVTFQLLFDPLLGSGVQKIIVGNSYTADPPILNTNNNIDFTGMKTNTSLEELDLSEHYMREEDCQNLFHAMKKNKGLENLKFHYWNYQYLPTRMKILFEEMMCENITLLYCCLHVHGRVQDRIFEVIQFHMKVNRMWKRYIIKREKEKKTRTVIPRIEEGDNNNNYNKEEEERNKRLKMKLLFHVFHQKTVLRNTILFHLLSEYPDDLIDTDHFRNQIQ